MSHTPKSYLDFISDIDRDSRLTQQLRERLPFPDQYTLRAWFISLGYELSEQEGLLLYQSQDQLMQPGQQVNY